MAPSHHVELEAAKLLQKLIQESKDEPSKLVKKLYVIRQHMRMTGKEHSLPYQVISREMEAVISQHGIDIDALRSSRLLSSGGTQQGDKEVLNNQLHAGGSDIPNKPPVGISRMDSMGIDTHQGHMSQSSKLSDHGSPASVATENTRSANSQDKQDSVKSDNQMNKKDDKKTAAKRERADSKGTADVHSQQSDAQSTGSNSRKGEQTNKGGVQGQFAIRGDDHSQANPSQYSGHLENLPPLSTNSGQLFRVKQEGNSNLFSVTPNSKISEEGDMSAGSSMIGLHKGGLQLPKTNMSGSTYLWNQDTFNTPLGNSKCSTPGLTDPSSTIDNRGTRPINESKRITHGVSNEIKDYVGPFQNYGMLKDSKGFIGSPDMGRHDVHIPNKPPVGLSRMDSMGVDAHQGHMSQSSKLSDHESPASVPTEDTRSANSQDKQDSVKSDNKMNKKDGKKTAAKRERADSNGTTDVHSQQSDARTGSNSRKGEQTNKGGVQGQFAIRCGDHSQANPSHCSGHLENLPPLSSSSGQLFRVKQEVDSNLFSVTPNSKIPEEGDMSSGSSMVGLKEGGQQLPKTNMSGSTYLWDQNMFNMPLGNSSGSIPGLTDPSSTIDNGASTPGTSVTPPMVTCDGDYTPDVLLLIRPIGVKDAKRKAEAEAKEMPSVEEVITESVATDAHRLGIINEFMNTQKIMANAMMDTSRTKKLGMYSKLASKANHTVHEARLLALLDEELFPKNG